MTAEPVHDTLIGRTAELGVLLGALDTAAAGPGGQPEARVVLVSGDAGVGKTRLVGEACEIARARGHTVLVGQCAELGESMPYLPLADALWTATRDSRIPEDQLAALRAALAARPVLGRLLPDAAAGGGGASDLAQQQLFGAALGLLGELADARPVVLVLEDLHWADRSTRDLLTFLSRVLQRERICLIGTYRSDDLHRRHPLRPLVAELLRLPNVSAVELRPFGPEDTAAYLTVLEGNGPPPPGVVERIFNRSEGNAFYAAELLAAQHTGEENLPAGLADLLMARVERLSEPAQQVVRVAAVAGRRVDDELVRQVSGLSEAECEQALREIVSHQLLLPDGPRGYTFRHALLREAVYGDLLPGEKTRLHATFAALLSKDGRSAAELAHHSLAAHDLPGAFDASVEAAHEAERVGAPAEAYEHLDRALSLWEAVPEPERIAGLDRVRLSLRAAAAAAAAGEVRRAMTRVRRLLDLVDPQDVILAAEVRERLAYYLGDLDRVEESLAYAREALDLLPKDPPHPHRARALATYIRTIMWADYEVDITRDATEAIEIARATGAHDAEASSLVTLGLHIETKDAAADVEEIFATAWSLARGSGDLQVALRAKFHTARAKLDRGDLAGAAVAIEKGVRFTSESGLGWSTYGTNMRYMHYLIEYTAGRWDRAAALADGFGIRVATVQEATLSSYALFLDVARGAATVAERLRYLKPLWDEDAQIRFIAGGVAAEHALWEGDDALALEHITATMTAVHIHDAAQIRLATTALWVHADRAARARAAGDRAGAEAAVQAAGPLVEHARTAAVLTPVGHRRAWLGLEGIAWLKRAEAEWHRVRGDDKPDHWRAVVDAFDYGYEYEVARSRWRLAESLVEHGERDLAEAEWRQAVESAERLGAAPLRRALAGLGRRARFDVAADEPAPAGALAGLTGRELEVLRLVAAGRNNREIAAALFISPKTASVHVSNILAKLGVASRTQAAAVAHREGLEA